jgi:hypothetical protein
MEAILENFGVPAVEAGLIAVVLYFLFKRYFGTYMDEKAKNIATKEDIVEITRKVEDVKHEYLLKLNDAIESIKHEHSKELAKIAEDLKARSSLRVLAGEKRLEVHQQAYSLWNRLLSMTQSSDERKHRALASECMDFWMANCLYLSPPVRNVFPKAVVASRHHHSVSEMYKTSKFAEDHVAIEANYETVRSLGDLITKACELPVLNEDALVQDIGSKE